MTTIETPVAELLPPLSDEERERLRVDIEANGVRVPVEVCANTGEMLDGAHRAELAAEVGKDCPRVERCHRALAPRRRNGEWFAAPPDDAVAAVEAAPKRATLGSPESSRQP